MTSALNVNFVNDHDALNVFVVNLSDALANINTFITDTTTRLSVIEKAATSLTARVSTAEDKITTAIQELTLLTTRVSSTEQSITFLNTQVAESVVLSKAYKASFLAGYRSLQVVGEGAIKNLIITDAETGHVYRVPSDSNNSLATVESKDGTLRTPCIVALGDDGVEDDTYFSEAYYPPADGTLSNITISEIETG
uniref:Uncharacterized protein n=1 Tax=Hepeviridae sp. TaxID=2715178 RepID=A0A6M3YPV6_9VIRU|nr:MAG: hypothetical protein [Hepeviridae sp.]